MQRGKMNIVVSIIIFVVVIAILVFISFKIKKEAPVDSQIGETTGQNVEENNMQQNTTNTIQPSADDAKEVKVLITKEGTGAIAKSGDTVSMNYTGRLVGGTVFDSNVDPKFGHVEPFVFTVGAGQVIKGWDVGVAGMKVGEKRTLEIKPDYAYGASGITGAIPPNAVLTFDVELIAIQN
jgi:peptidylprolyl isomerase